MQAVITCPDGVRAGIDSPAARELIDVTSDSVEQVVRRSRALNGVDRLSVYGNAYYSRLVECMAAEFPAVQHAVGEEAFSGFVFGYLQEFPSTSYTLSDLGNGFPDYLAASRPPRESESPDWADFLVDVATLERLYSDVFDGPGEERLTMIDAEQLKAIPEEKWGDVRFETAASLRLVELRFPVHDFVTSVRHDKTVTFPEPAATRLVVNRRDYVVRRREMPPLPFDVLNRLQSGETLGLAIERAVAASETDVSELPGRLRKWFREWTAAGYFVSVNVR